MGFATSEMIDDSRKLNPTQDCSEITTGKQLNSAQLFTLITCNYSPGFLLSESKISNKLKIFNDLQHFSKGNGN